MDFKHVFHLKYLTKIQWIVVIILSGLLLFVLWRLKKSHDNEQFYLIKTEGMTNQEKDNSNWVTNANDYSKIFGNNLMNQHLQYTGTPVPLPEGELFMFANNKSSPSCCSSATYSTVDGCVCTSMDQIKYLNERGGNRTAYGGDSEF